MKLKYLLSLFAVALFAFASVSSVSENATKDKDATVTEQGKVTAKLLTTYNVATDVVFLAFESEFHNSQPAELATIDTASRYYELLRRRSKLPETRRERLPYLRGPQHPPKIA